MIPPGPDVSGLDQAEAMARLKDWEANALREIDMDPRFYTTSVAMDDLDDVRQALGYDKINLFGHSYGATAAQYYMRQHADHVRTVTLSGGTLLDLPVFTVWAANAQRALDKLFDRCEADSACHRAYPEVREEFAALMSRLDKDPVTQEVYLPDSKQTVSVTYTSGLFAEASRVIMLDARNAAKLPRVIHKAYTEDNWTAFNVLFAKYGTADWGEQVMEHVIRCGEKWAAFNPDEVARLSEGSFMADWQIQLAQNHALACQLTPVGEMPEGQSAQPGSQSPVLIINGDMDPQGPPDNMAGAQKLWPNSLSVVESYQGHWLSDSSEIYCRWSIMDAFIETGSVEGLDTSCMKHVMPPVFDTQE